MTEPDWQPVFSSPQPHLIEIARNILAENNIENVLLDKRDSAFTMGELEIYVKPVDVMRAKFLIEKNNLE